MRNLKKISDAEIERDLVIDAENNDAWESPIKVPPSNSPRPEWSGREGKKETERFVQQPAVVKNLEQILSELASQDFQGILSPITEERLIQRGISIRKPPKLTSEESIEMIFGERRKQQALITAKALPQPPELAAPSIQSLYDEIRQSIILGLNGAAITLCGILVEHTLKYATYKVEVGGFAKYDFDKADEFERFTFGPAIERAAKAGLITPEDVEKLRYFKDTYRNPYNHYNLKKITSNYRVNGVRVLNTKTGDVEMRDIAARDNPVIQAQAKPRADADNVLEVFTFADSVVKALWVRLDQIKASQDPVS